MVTQGEIVSTARRCLGTPFRHQGRRPGRGLDCVGVIAWTARELGLSCYDVTNYSRLPQGRALLRHLEEAGMVEVEAAKAGPGDVVAMRFQREVQHLALLTDRGMLHAYYGAGAVVEHRLDATWRGRIVAAFRFPGLG
jgi:cell wall-associated NlpC family hydrolase